jgi:hypothetical protein
MKDQYGSGFQQGPDITLQGKAQNSNGKVYYNLE